MPLLRNRQLPASKGVFPRSILRFGRFRSFWKCRIMLCRGYWVGSLLELVYITTYQAKKQAAISGRLLKALLEELAVNLVLESLASIEDRSVAGILISLPVAGLRPVRASRCLRAKVPKPIRVTGLPAATESTMEAKTLSTAAAASFWLSSHSAATFLTSSVLFM